MGCISTGAVRERLMARMMRSVGLITGWRSSTGGPRCRLPVEAIAVCALIAMLWQPSLRGEQPIPLPPVDAANAVEALPPPSAAAEKAPEEGWSWPDWAGSTIDWSSFDWGWQGFPRLAPGSTTYVVAEMVAFQRDNQSNDVPLVTDTLTGETVLSVGDLEAAMAYGARAFVGVKRCDSWGMEAGYLGVYGMNSTRTLTGFENLQLAGPLAGLVPLPFEAADRVEATYSSIFQSGEINIFKSCCQTGRGGGDACDAAACGNECGGCCIDWLGGFRYVNLSEQAGLTFTCCTESEVGPFTSSYDVQTSNNLFGGQFGGRASRTWRNWAVEGWAKAGVFANLQNQSQAPILDPLNPGTPARDARSASGVEPAMMADLNLSVIYRINRVFGLRVGYNALWVGNVALAPDQWDFGASADSGTGLAGNGGLFLTGATFGIDAYW